MVTAKSGSRSYVVGLWNLYDTGLPQKRSFREKFRSCCPLLLLTAKFGHFVRCCWLGQSFGHFIWCCCWRQSFGHFIWCCCWRQIFGNFVWYCCFTHLWDTCLNHALELSSNYYLRPGVIRGDPFTNKGSYSSNLSSTTWKMPKPSAIISQNRQL